MLTRRLILTSGLAAIAAPAIARASHLPSQQPQPTPVTQRLVVLGDSYSDVDYTSFRNWSEQLVARGRAASLTNLALSGASALTYDTSVSRAHLKSQLDIFLADPNYGPDDVTVVYLGYNDIARYTDTRWTTLDQAQRDYKAGLDRLLQAGAADGARRLIPVIVHDWSKNPKHYAEYVPRTKVWVAYVNYIANLRKKSFPGIISANIYSRFNDIFARPQAYGLNNVTTADPSHAGTTALYTNSGHFGLKGHTLLADEFSRTLDLVAKSR